jgi:hypothetical protein
VNRVLSDRDSVAVVELLLLDRLAIDKRAIGAPEVYDPERLTSPFDASVMATRGGIAKDEVIVGRTPEPECCVTGAVRMPRIRS